MLLEFGTGLVSFFCWFLPKPTMETSNTNLSQPLDFIAQQLLTFFQCHCIDCWNSPKSWKSWKSWKQKLLFFVNRSLSLGGEKQFHIEFSLVGVLCHDQSCCLCWIFGPAIGYCCTLQRLVKILFSMFFTHLDLDLIKFILISINTQFFVTIRDLKASIWE